MTDQHADTVLDQVAKIRSAMQLRMHRERLWDMPLSEVDLEAMAWEIAEALRLIDGNKP